jgi:hypothetical protein
MMRQSGRSSARAIASTLIKDGAPRRITVSCSTSSASSLPSILRSSVEQVASWTITISLAMQSARSAIAVIMQQLYATRNQLTYRINYRFSVVINFLIFATSRYWKRSGGKGRPPRFGEFQDRYSLVNLCDLGSGHLRPTLRMANGVSARFGVGHQGEPDV